MAFGNERQKSLHIQTLSFALFLGLLIYYGVIIFHWQFILGIITRLSIPAVSLVALWLFPIALKFGVVEFQVHRNQSSRKKALNAIKLVSFYLFVFLSIVGIAVKSNIWLSHLFNSQYWQNSHWFWICTVVFLVFGIIWLFIWQNGLISWDMLQDLKGIPIVSPIFCFGAPSLWTNNLAYASLDRSLLVTYSTLSILAGVIFLFYLVVFGIMNHKLSKKEETKNIAILGLDEKPLSKTSNDMSTATIICLAIFGIGLYILSIVLVSVLVHIAIA